MTPVDIQKIVDGECTHGERAALLSSVGNDVATWRALALAALEEQHWSREISIALVDRSIQACADSDSNADETSHTISSPSIVSLSEYRSGTKRVFRWGHGLSALAAGFLFLVGLYGGSWMRQNQPAGSGAANSSLAINETPKNATPVSASSNSIQDFGSRYRRDSNSAMTMLVSGPNETSSEIPLMNASDIDPSFMLSNEAYTLAKLKQQFRQQGFEADVQPQFYSGRLRDGRQIVVPVHNVSLRPAGL